MQRKLLFHSLHIDALSACQCASTAYANVQALPCKHCLHIIGLSACQHASTFPWTLPQVAAEPLLLGLFEELLRDEGSELYTRAPEVYGVPVGVQKTWDEVSTRLSVIKVKRWSIAIV